MMQVIPTITDYRGSTKVPRPYFLMRPQDVHKTFGLGTRLYSHLTITTTHAMVYVIHTSPGQSDVAVRLPLNTNRLSFLSTVTVATGRLSILPSAEEEEPHTMR